MPPRKEPCRNFQRGFCQYGERCKFLHANQQQAKPNPFGFGTQNATQAQKPNPFGFGVQNNSQIGSKPNQFKPGENKWSRFGNSSSAPQKQDNQASAPNHVCTDSESCKLQIKEDFEQEKPLWKLTCYGHRKYGPCDIVGDISCEELRASAYDDAKRGMNIQSIVEKERSLLSSKLIEFENLLRNPYIPSQNSTLTTQNTFPGNNNTSSPIIQNNVPPSVSSFSQLGTTINAGFQMRPATTNNAFGQSNQLQAPTNNAFGQSNHLQAPTNNAFGQSNQLQAPTNNAFGQSNQFQSPTQVSNASQKNSFAFGNPGLTGSQPSNQLFPSSIPATTTTFGNTGMNAFSNAGIITNLDLARQQSSMPFGGLNASANVVSDAVSSAEMTQKSDSIWLKDEWRAGEIPEEAPPEGVIY